MKTDRQIYAGYKRARERGRVSFGDLADQLDVDEGRLRSVVTARTRPDRFSYTDRVGDAVACERIARWMGDLTGLEHKRTHVHRMGLDLIGLAVDGDGRAVVDGDCGCAINIVDLAATIDGKASGTSYQYTQREKDHDLVEKIATWITDHVMWITDSAPEGTEEDVSANKCDAHRLGIDLLVMIKGMEAHEVEISGEKYSLTRLALQSMRR